MKSYAVVLFDAGRVEDFTHYGKGAFSQIRNALRSFRPNKVRPCTVEMSGKSSSMQVHQAESITTPSMLLVKDGFLSNVCDTADIVTYDEQVAKLNELKTAAMLLKAAEEKLLLTVAKSIFMDLPMDACSNRDVSSQEAITKINKRIAEHPVIMRSANPKYYGERVFKYITQNPTSLQECIFTGII